MRFLRFSRLQLLSTIEKAALDVEFDKSRTVVHGGNQTGKSSLLKSLYWTLGAEPATINPTWRKLDVTAVISFDVHGTSLKILRHKNQFAVFDSNGKILKSFKKVGDLAPWVAAQFDFKLKLVNRQGELVTPPPAYLYLPFCIDQDASWKSNWSSFRQLSQFSQWKLDVSEFHAGIRPGAYFELKGKRSSLEAARNEAELEQKVVALVLDRIKREAGSAEFNLDMDLFKQEIERLITAASALLGRENEYKAHLRELHSERTELVEQIRFAERAAADLDRDYKFATDELQSSEVSCPICGTEYQNSFAERFSIAVDEDKVLLLVSDIQNRINEIDSEVAKINAEFFKNSTEKDDIGGLLQTKRQTVTLAEILKQEGRREADAALEARSRELAATVIGYEADLRDIAKELKSLTDKKRKSEILDYYRRRMALFLIRLNVATLPESSYAKIDSTISETGSNLPRALLAYYFSVLHTIQKFGDSTFCPIVIDSPNQQAQDKPNLKAILAFINDNQPPDSQLILGCEEDLNVKLEGKRIELSKKYQLLKGEAYDGVSAEVLPMLAATLEMS